VILDFILLISIVSVSEKGNEKICEKIVACPFGDLTKPTANEPKKN
jgi:hypothetical protein